MKKLGSAFSLTRAVYLDGEVLDGFKTVEPQPRLLRAQNGTQEWEGAIQPA